MIPSFSYCVLAAKKKRRQIVEKVKEVKQFNKTPDKYNNKELSALLQYKKRETDTAIPTRKLEMLSLYHQWYTPNKPTYRPSPINSPVASDDEKTNSGGCLSDFEDEEALPVLI